MRGFSLFGEEFGLAQFDLNNLVKQIDTIYRDLGAISVTQRRGMRAAISAADVFEDNPGPLGAQTLMRLNNMVKDAGSKEERDRLEKILFGCMDLVIENETASLTDMMNFYTAGGRMHVDGEKIPLVEAVPWVQAQPDFSKREVMKKECSIFFKGIINPILTGITELIIRLCSERFGYETYSDYCATKKGVDFQALATEYESYLNETDQVYQNMMAPWVRERIGEPFNNGLSRYHALYLARISEFDEFFPPSGLDDAIYETFKGIGFDLGPNSGITLDTSVYEAKNPDGICVGVEIPGDVHVLIKPVGGLIDYETLLHETGHAYFISNMAQDLPLEDRRLYRSPALDECFAFLFMELVGNRAWLNSVARCPREVADELARLHRTRRLCLIRRHIGKFLAEKDLFDSNSYKDPEPYCARLSRATGFSYEPEGYLVDMSSEFYALDYITAWSCVESLSAKLEKDFGEQWFMDPKAGEFLRDIAARGRSRPAGEALTEAGCQEPYLPSGEAF
jgi:hypothetical protein